MKIAVGGYVKYQRKWQVSVFDVIPPILRIIFIAPYDEYVGWVEKGIQCIEHRAI